MIRPKSFNLDMTVAGCFEQRASVPEKFILLCGGVNGSVFSLPFLKSHDCVRIYRGYTTLIFTHHLKIVPSLQFSHNKQLQDTPVSKQTVLAVHTCNTGVGIPMQ